MLKDHIRVSKSFTYLAKKPVCFILLLAILQSIEFQLCLCSFLTKWSLVFIYFYMESKVVYSITVNIKAVLCLCILSSQLFLCAV